VVVVEDVVVVSAIAFVATRPAPRTVSKKTAKRRRMEETYNVSRRRPSRAANRSWPTSNCPIPAT
jgi:hypothetical protein